jgi:hypothetical protein
LALLFRRRCKFITDEAIVTHYFLEFCGSGRCHNNAASPRPVSQADSAGNRHHAQLRAGGAGFIGPALVGDVSRTFEKSVNNRERCQFIGGSDARVIMGDDQAALLLLWREKRGEVEPQDLSRNLIVQLGVATEALNRRWYEANSGQVIADVQRHVRHTTLRWMGATLDGRVEATGAVFEAKFMLPWSFSEEGRRREVYGAAPATKVAPAR